MSNIHAICGYESLLMLTRPNKLAIAILLNSGLITMSVPALANTSSCSYGL